MNFKLNKEGSIGIGAAFVVFIVTLGFISILYMSAANNLKISGKTSELNGHYVNASNGKERLHGALYENLSLIGEIEFEDLLEDTYEIATVSESFSTRTINLTGGSLPFLLKNKTDINISVSATPLTFESVCNYYVSLANENGTEMIQDTELNHYDKSFHIPGEMLYNEQTGETNLGNFVFSINSSGCVINAQISYEELVEREISVKGNSLDLNLLIEGITNGKITIKGGN